jgi:hypothetical protein
MCASKCRFYFDNDSNENNNCNKSFICMYVCMYVCTHTYILAQSYYWLVSVRDTINASKSRNGFKETKHSTAFKGSDAKLSDV